MIQTAGPRHPNWLPPSELAIQVGQYFDNRDQPEQTILDYGCAEGRNAQYLSSLGHTVVGVSVEMEEVKLAAKFDFNARSNYLVGDVRYPMFRSGVFDAVIMSEVTHLLPKTDSKRALQSVRSLTKPGGINAVSGYLLTPEVQSPASKERAFSQFELLQSYVNLGWQILHYDENIRPVSRFNDQEMLNSKASLVAKKPKR